MAKKIDLTGLDHFKEEENESIAYIESSSTASKAHKVGERFYFKGKLVICTVDIASGGTIILSPTANYNCKLDVLGDDVSAQSEQIVEISGNVVGSYVVINGLYISTNGTLTSLSGTDRVICVTAKPNKTYVVKKDTATITRVGCGSSASLTADTKLKNYSGHATASADALTVKTDSTNYYIYIQLFADTDSSGYKTIDANVKSLIVYEGMSEEIKENAAVNDLLSDTIADAESTVTFTNGMPTSVVFTRGGSTIRTDTITYSGSTITETRVGFGHTLTIVTDLSDNSTEVTLS